MQAFSSIGLSQNPALPSQGSNTHHAVPVAHHAKLSGYENRQTRVYQTTPPLNCFSSNIGWRTSLSTRAKPSRRSKALASAGPGQGGGGGSGNFGGGGGGGGSGGPGDYGSNLPRTVAIFFALLVAVGGYMGYRKKGSVASLKASAAVSGLLLLAAALIGSQHNAAGLLLALAANVALGGYMLKGYINTRKVFPQAVFSTICGLNSLMYLKTLLGT